MKALPISDSETRELLEPLLNFPRLALAVSGGPDSLALMLLAARWRAALGSGPRLCVLTVDHRLRQASREEAELVARVAAELGLPHTILTWAHKELQPKSLQVKARTARYNLMAAHCHAHDIPSLVTAHHLDDQAETFLMRLKRGSGLDGLAAIPVEGEWAGITILRPLLDVPKARLVASVDAAGIEYVSDPSNEDSRFERARLRKNLDALAAIGLTPEALALSARRLRRAREALENVTQEFIAAHAEISESGFALIDWDALASSAHEIAIRVLARLIVAIGGREEPVALAKLEALLSDVEKHPEKTHTLGRCRLEPYRRRLGIFREVRARGLPVAKLRPGERKLWDNRFRIELGAGEAEPIIVKALGDSGFSALRERSEIPASLPIVAGRSLPACWRGDVLVGLPRIGHTGSKKTARLDCRAVFVSAGEPLK